MKRTRSEVGKYSKRKGARFESEVCKSLNKKFEGYFTFERSPSSGGTVYRGDLLAKTLADDKRESKPVVFFPITFELKNRESWTYQSIFTDFIKSEIYSYWNQGVNDAAAWKNDPLLVFSKNYHPIYALFEPSKFRKYCTPNMYTLLNPHISIDLEDECHLVITTFKSLLSTLDSAAVSKYATG